MSSGNLDFRTILFFINYKRNHRNPLPNPKPSQPTPQKKTKKPKTPKPSLNNNHHYNTKKIPKIQMLLDLLLLALLCLSAGLSQWVHMGGLPILNILFLLILAQSKSDIFASSLQLSLPISYALMIGSSLYMSVRESGKKSGESTHRFAFDYDLVALAVPVCASGAIFGVLAKNFSSDLLLTISYLILLIFLIYRFTKPSTTHCTAERDTSTAFLDDDGKQSKQMKELKAKLVGEREQSWMESEQIGAKYNKTKNREEELNPELQKILDEENNRLPKQKLKILGFVVLYTLGILVARNASIHELIVINPPINIPKAFQETIESSPQENDQLLPSQALFEQESNINIKINPETGQKQGSSCIVGSFLLIIIHLTMSYLSSKSVAIQTATKDSEKQKHGYVFYKETDKMTSTKFWRSMLSGFCGGFLVGLFGIGSSIILEPLWIQNGIDSITARTSATPVTFVSALISTCLYLLTGNEEYGVFLLIGLMLLGGGSAAFVDWMLSRLGYAGNQSVYYWGRVGLLAISVVAVGCYGVPAYFWGTGFRRFGYFC